MFAALLEAYIITVNRKICETLKRVNNQGKIISGFFII